MHGRVFLWRLLFAFVLTSVTTAVGLAGGSLILQHKITRAKQVALHLDNRLPGSMNFLILGSDSRAFVDNNADESSFGDTGVVGGQRADVIIIAHVEPRARRGVLVSIPRDTLVHLPNHSGLRLINESFGDGPQGVIDAVKSNFGIPIHHYVEMDFAGFRSIVDALGGVRMFMPAPSRDKMTGLDIATAGCVRLDGTQALAWVRSRYYTYYEGGKWRTDPTSDLGRIRRQQEFIHQLMVQVVEKGALNPLRANRLADAALAKLTVDKDFSLRDGLRLVDAFRPAGTAGIEMLTLPTRPVGAHLLPTSASEAVLGRLRPEAPAPAGGKATAAVGPQTALPEVSTPLAAPQPAPAPSGASPHAPC